MRLAFAVPVVGLGLGFAAGLALIDGFAPPTAINVTANLRDNTASIAAFGDGWGPLEGAGVVLVERSAILALPLPRQAPSDLVLEVHAIASKAVPAGGAHLDVAVNGLSLGNWRLSGERVKRLLVPSHVAAGGPLAVTFATDAPGAVAVGKLVVQEMSLLEAFAGHLDDCRGGAVSGWAKSGLGSAPVAVRRGGRIVTTIMASVERPDLPPAGHPLDAGFRIALAPPVRPGETIEVVFPNGALVAGSPCRT